MQELLQKTLIKPISFNGIGLHSGVISQIKILPAGEDEGIKFKRVDLKENNIIEANFKNVSSAKLCTTLSNSFGTEVSTVEHLMAAFYITGIDNAIVEVNNKEIPIMDGSSKDFINIINQAGIKNLNKKRKFLKILKKFEIKENNKIISIEPCTSGLEVSFELKYQNKIIGNQKNKVKFNEKNLEDIYSSRTFCLYEDIEKIKKNGLAKGGSLENAVVVNSEKVMNDGGLRNSKEFVNHKILDLAGDFLLSGFRIIGSVICVQGGHHLSNSFLRELFNQKENFIEINTEHNSINKETSYLSQDKLVVNA